MTPPASTVPTAYRETEPDQQVAWPEALQEWAVAAWEALEIAAATAGTSVTDSDLASFVQAKSGIRTRAHRRSWLPKILGVLGHRIALEDAPALTALVVGPKGRVADGFDTTLELQLGRPPKSWQEREKLAAGAREDAYLAYGPQPEQGPQAPLAAAPSTAVDTDQTTVDAGEVAASAAVAAAATVEQPPAVCPGCFMQLPATGICDLCR